MFSNLANGEYHYHDDTGQLYLQLAVQDDHVE